MISTRPRANRRIGHPGITDFSCPDHHFHLFWFMLIRPQMKRAKEQKKMLSELAKGDEIVTSSGQVGKVTKIGDQYVSLEIADGVITHVQKQSVQTLLPKGTIKGL